MKIHRRALSFLLVLGTLALAAHPALAFEPKLDFWFSEMIQVGEVGLPQGVTIRTCDPLTQPRACLILENQTETLLFVLALNYKDVLVMATPDPNLSARLGLAHEVASYLVAPEHPAYLNMEALADLDRKLVDQNVVTFDPPPEHLAIPSAQNSELLLVYGQQVIEVPFTVSYSLNTRFDNGIQAHDAWMEDIQATDSAHATATRQAEMASGRDLGFPLVVGGLVMLAVFIAAGWLAWKGLAQGPRDKPKG